ncbi:hypothetical protein HJA82_29710 [Rhizobium bangladeshense]|uniref:hypothetical protein n=1 Tax=Rhizobium bangladeshense TaxID=1138189 RepID=UPI001C83F6D5|nr:hypothetical protein [Rhizobium bangladeshense]MBX4911494.1 hypothetical protein [Rhizobium bangladeshense]
MTIRIALALLGLSMAAAHAADIQVTDDTPARAVSITKAGEVFITSKVYTMVECKQALEENADDFKARANTILCVPADMSTDGVVVGELPLIDLTK